jgi:transketolase N-terminal domain/subunit
MKLNPVQFESGSLGESLAMAVGVPIRHRLPERIGFSLRL